jgi:FkbM family methyltransferase
MFSSLIQTLLRVPLLGDAMRWYGRSYAEGSVVEIPFGCAAGLKWKRYHRHVSGYWSGIYEMEVQKILARELHSGDVFYDVGANAGFFSLIAAKLVGPEGRVFAFEPVSENHETIGEQFQINQFQNCTVVPVAVSGESGTMPIHLTANTSMARLGGTDTGSTSIVETVSLASFVQGHPLPDFIKMDVEGAEAEVLESATSLLMNEKAPTLLVEIHGSEAGARVFAKLRACGYSLRELNGNEITDNIPFPYHILAQKK